MVQPIVNSYAIKTRKNKEKQGKTRKNKEKQGKTRKKGWNGNVLTCTITLTMLSGVMKQLSSLKHRRHCHQKLGEKLRSKPRAKHPTKVPVWAGISRKGTTQVCIFEGIMAAPLYCEILQQTLLPFIQEHFPPTTHRFKQDNDPKHTSRIAQQFYMDSYINWWKTSAESPDMNPIENLWHELKEHIVEKSIQQPNRS